jgi:predicted DNA-binding protein
MGLPNQSSFLAFFKTSQKEIPPIAIKTKERINWCKKDTTKPDSTMIKEITPTIMNVVRFI